MADLRAAQPQAMVADLTRAVGFYVAKLGFTLVYLYGEPPFYGLVRRGAAAINLRHIDDPSRWRPDLAEAMLTAAIPVVDLAGLHAEYAAREVHFAQPLTRQAWGATDFIVQDPDGNLLCFAEAALPDG